MRHELLFPITTLPRATARPGKRRPILLASNWPPPKPSLLPLTNNGPFPSSATHVADGERNSAALPQPPAASAHSNHISVRRRSGFLHVAVSKAPTSQPSVRDQFVMWALQIQPKDFAGPIRDSHSGRFFLCAAYASGAKMIMRDVIENTPIFHRVLQFISLCLTALSSVSASLQCAPHNE